MAKISLTYVRMTELLEDQPHWWHYLQVMVPDQVQFYNFAMLRVEGGSNTSGYFLLINSNCLNKNTLATGDVDGRKFSL